MLCKDLIKILEKMIEDNKPHEHIMGEAEIMFEKNEYLYKGITHDMKIEHTPDGVYNVLVGK